MLSFKEMLWTRHFVLGRDEWSFFLWSHHWISVDFNLFLPKSKYRWIRTLQVREPAIILALLFGVLGIKGNKSDGRGALAIVMKDAIHLENCIYRFVQVWYVQFYPCHYEGHISDTKALVRTKPEGYGFSYADAGGWYTDKQP